MSKHHESKNGALTANPRFLDRMNAVCTAGLAGVLVAFGLLAIQAQSYTPPSNGAVDVRIRGMNDSPSALEMVAQVKESTDGQAQ